MLVFGCDHGVSVDEACENSHTLSLPCIGFLPPSGIDYALRDTGLIQKDNGRYQLSASVEDLHDLDFPDTIEGVIISRIDLLPPQEQLALKVGSVIGRMFAYPTLRDIHPLPDQKQSLRTYLDSLEQLDILLQENPEPELAYVFKHLITQEVAYNLMTSAQKKALTS